MNVGDLCRDLLAERDELLALLATVGDRWRQETPAPGFSIRDQITHLASFDEAAALAISTPAEFIALREEQRTAALYVVEALRQASYSCADDEIIDWLTSAGNDLVSAARSADPTVRVPWYGPEMSLASCLTARIMETWAHGQDVFDSLGAARQPSARLQHIAFLGWRALAHSFTANGLDAPTEAVRVELGDVAFGPPDAPNCVRGSLLDFCLLVCQRRHVHDTDLTATGPVARQWLSIAQAFAGPPGAGRSPGQFR